MILRYEIPRLFTRVKKVSWVIGMIVVIENVSYYFDSLKVRIEVFLHSYIQICNYIGSNVIVKNYRVDWSS